MHCFQSNLYEYIITDSLKSNKTPRSVTVTSHLKSTRKLFLENSIVIKSFINENDILKHLSKFINILLILLRSKILS